MARPPAHAPLLSEELIVAATLKLIEQEGWQALSMRKLAAALGVASRSLYHYFATKEDLMNAVFVHVLQTLPPPPVHAPWQEQFRALARGFRTLCHHYPQVAPHFLSACQPVHPQMQISEFVCQTLLRAGIAPQQALLLTTSLITGLLGYVLSELGGGGSAECRRKRAGFAALHADLYPQQHALFREELSNDEGFELHLDFLLAGICGLLPTPAD